MCTRIVVVSMFLLLASHCAYGLTLWVGNGSGCSFPSIQAAVDFAAGSSDPDKSIVLLANATYSGERIHIDSQALTIRGDGAGCGSLFYVEGGTATIDGSGGPDTSLITITGSSVISLQGLFIAYGHTGSGNFGGCILVDGGTGRLNLQNVAVDECTAGYGAGISVRPSGQFLLALDSNAIIADNTAQVSGGGLRIEGSTMMFADSPAMIFRNRAISGLGGGIDVVAPANAEIGSAGLGGIPFVSSNMAAFGGGIAVEGIDNEVLAAKVVLFSTVAENPVQVSNNTATITGGGIYLKPYTSISQNSAAELDAYDFRIDGNIAPEGAALALDSATTFYGFDLGSTVYLNVGNPPSGGRVCGINQACNEISGNVAQDANGQPTEGAVIYVGTSSDFHASGLALHANVANYLMHAVGDNDLPDSGIFLRNCITGGNQIARELIRMAGDDGTLSIDSSTLAPDIINSTHVIHFDNSVGNSLILTDTIIDEPGTLTLSSPGIALTAQYLLSNDISTLPSEASIVLGEPQYVALPNGDYHLVRTSPGIDFAPAAGGLDFDGRPRDMNLPDVPNQFGPRDLGAYEIQTNCSSSDTVFCDGFEG